MDVILQNDLQIAMIGIAVLTMAAILISAIRTKLDVKSAIFWIFWCVIILIIGIFPGIARAFADLIGIRVVSNFIFLFMIGVLFCASYYAYIKMSKMSNEIKNLTYRTAELTKEINELKEKNQPKE